jgi:diguanylate cyclase (GGDEF)-like protein
LLDELLAEQRWPAEWTGSVVDQNRVVVARTREADRYRGQAVMPSLAGALKQPRAGVFESLTLDGVVVYASAAAVPGTGWWVVVGQPKAALRAQAWQALAGLMAAGLLSVLLATAASLGLARHIGRAIQRAAQDPAAEADNPVREIVSLRTQAERQAQALQQAQRDALTGLAGRAQFMAQAQARVDALAGDATRGVALLFIDLDNFKSVNDERGHDAGDAILVAVARVLQANARAEDVAARLGGDEFVLCLVAPAEMLGAVSQEVAQRVRRGVVGVDPTLGCSIGLARVREGESLSALIARADQAMLAAKRRGKNQVVVV